ncbi:MAG: hypothetical protein IIT86_01015 [Oscillospiraceae bacterium]|nr:hypothetical protein [Clostridia bacterium]MBQ5521387.1 hypothetical protein [Oscillospiraceae bacterium]
MRKFFRKLRDKANLAMLNLKAAVENKEAEGYVDSGVKILIAVVIGALLLAGLYALFNTTIMPTVTRKITDLFNYSGN